MKIKLLLCLLPLFLLLATCKKEKTDTQLRTEALPYSNKAQMAYTQGDYTRALIYIDSSLTIFADDQNLLFLRAKSHLLLKNKEDGLQALNTVIDKYPKLYSAYSERAIFYTGEKEYDKARADIDIAVAGLPDNKDLLAHLGIIQQYQKKHQEAIATFSKIHEIDSLNANTLFYRGLNKKWLNDFEGARSDLRKAETLQPYSYDTHDQLGAIELELGNHELAIEEFTANIAYGKSVQAPLLISSSLNNRANAFLKIKKYRKALADLDTSESTLPENAYIYRTRALVFLAQNNKRKACQQLEKALEMGFSEKHGSEVNELLATNCQ